jgi:hypothetical protein
LPFLNIDEIEDILKRKDQEEAERFADETEEQENFNGQSEAENR